MSRRNKTELTSHASGLTHDAANEKWEMLKGAIGEIQQGNSSQLRYEQLYRHAYTLVLHRHGDLLYEGVRKCIVDQLREMAGSVSTVPNEALMESISCEWKRHKNIMIKIRDILMYMDKEYCTERQKEKVYPLGLSLFYEIVVKDGSVRSRFQSVLLKAIESSRMGEQIDQVLMDQCVTMLLEVKMGATDAYKREFENGFLEATTNFYRQESQSTFARNSGPDYLRKIEKRFSEERRRAEIYLAPCTKEPLMNILKKELVNAYATLLVDNEVLGLVELCRHDCVEDLKRMYSVFAVDEESLDVLRRGVQKLITSLGTLVITDQENVKNPQVFVQEVLQLRQKFSTIIQNAFRSDRNFARALKDGIEGFINLDARAARYVALYLDNLHRTGLKGAPDLEVERRLEDALHVFRYLQDKDVFEQSYKQNLANRLLTGASASADIEKQMIKMLKAECGHQFTSRLEGMFKDIELSRQIMLDFGARQNAGADIHVTVLTTGFWPIVPVKQCVMPSVASQLCDAFSEHYVQSRSGRRLTWCPNLGTAELRCKFTRGRKELVVHTYQMFILMLFNEHDVLTYDEIRRFTNIPDEDLRRHVLSLAHPKVHILKKKPNTKQLEGNHKFMYNTDYASKMYRVKVKLLQMSSDVVKKQPVPPSVIEARKLRLDAVIVRVMKSRKTLEHSNLIAEVIRQVNDSFSVEPSFVKKRIEGLIERDYLERDDDNRRLYHYLA